MIKACSCKHEGQDSLHGKWQRVFNEVKSAKGTEYRCTVCGNVIKSSGEEKKK